MATEKLDRNKQLALIKLDCDQRLWDRVVRVGLRDSNPEVDEHLRTSVLAAVRTSFRPVRTSNIRPSLLISYATAKAIETKAWETLPSWEWISASKLHPQHNVYFEAMHIPGVQAFTDGNTFKEWLRNQCAGTASKQILPTIDGGLSMSGFILSVMNRIEDVIGLQKTSSDQVFLPAITLDRKRATKLLKLFGLTQSKRIEDDLTHAICKAKIPAIPGK